MVQEQSHPEMAFFACYNGDPPDYGSVPAPYFYLKRMTLPAGSTYTTCDDFAWYNPDPDADEDSGRSSTPSFLQQWSMSEMYSAGRGATAMSGCRAFDAL